MKAPILQVQHNTDSIIFQEINMHLLVNRFHAIFFHNELVIETENIVDVAARQIESEQGNFFARHIVAGQRDRRTRAI